MGVCVIAEVYAFTQHENIAEVEETSRQPIGVCDGETDVESRLPALFLRCIAEQVAGLVR